MPSSVAESALQTYVAMKVSEKGWHRVGRYYAHGDLLGKSVVDVALVRMVCVHSVLASADVPSRKSTSQPSARRCLCP